MVAPTTDDVVTLIVRHRVKAGKDEDYERWLRHIIGVASRYPGHLGIDVVREVSSGMHLFTCVLRFASTGQLQVWLDSDDRRLLIEEVTPLLADGDQTEVNAQREFWFNPAASVTGAAAPARWKQACVTFLVILPLTLVIPQLWQPVFSQVPWLGGYVQSNVLITLSIVLLVVYQLMPRATSWFANWLNAP